MSRSSGNLLILGAAIAALFVWTRARADTADDYVVPEDDYMIDESDPLYGSDNPDEADMLDSAANFDPSNELETMLKRGEGLRLTPYQLGDGGWTLGYGRFFPFAGGPPPASISQSTADEWFSQDLEERGAKWVRMYVTTPINQFQFDALCSLAYNLKPSSFKTIADAVNAGRDPEPEMLNFIREGTNLERGLRIRRAREIALYRSGVYS